MGVRVTEYGRGDTRQRPTRDGDGVDVDVDDARARVDVLARRCARG